MPLSEDVLLVVAGYLVGRGYTNPVVTAAICYPCVIAGDVLLYEAGRRLGSWPWARKHLKRIFTPARRHFAERFFARWGILAVAIARQVIGLRSPAFVFAGVARMPRAEFVVTDALAGLLAVPLFMAMGYFAARGVERLGGKIHWLELGLLGVALLGGAIYVAARALLQRKGRSPYRFRSS